MTLCKAPEDRRSAQIRIERGQPLPIYLQALCPVSIFNFMQCRTSYRQALDLCVQETFWLSNLHCHLVKPRVFSVSRTDLLSSLEPNQCCYPECHLGKGAQKGGHFFPQYMHAQRTIEACQQARVPELWERG